MKNFEMLLKQINNPTVLRKLAIIFVFTGMVICLLLLLEPIKNMPNLFIFLSKIGIMFFLLAFFCLYSKTIAEFIEDTKNSKLIIIINVLICVLLLGFLSILSYKYLWKFSNSDHAAHMVLGKLLAEENAFVSRNWYSSTEMALIGSNLITMPLFKLLGRYENWKLIRALFVFLSNLILILSYLFMARQIKIKTKWIFITCNFLIMPLSWVYFDMITFSGSYTFIIAALFCCLGLFIKLAYHVSTAKKLLTNFILYTLLLFVTGVQGIRYFIIFNIPLLITCLYCYSKIIQKKKYFLFLGCYSLIVSGIGYLVNNLLHSYFYFYSYEVMNLDRLNANFFPKLGEILYSIVNFLGFSYGIPLLSINGLFSIIAIIGTFFLFWAVLKSLTYAKIQNNIEVQLAEQQFITSFFIISFIFNIFVLIVIEQEIISRYFIPFMVFFIPLIAIFFEHIEKSYGHLKRIAIISGIILFILGQSYLTVRYEYTQDRYSNSSRNGYIRYLLDNQLKYGFATFWNANITTELSNGKIEISSLMPDLTYYYWLTPMKYTNSSYHQGEIFLLLSQDEWKDLQLKKLYTQHEPDYEDNSFIIIKYSSIEAFRSYEINSLIKKFSDHVIKGFSGQENTLIWTDQEEAEISIPIQKIESDLRLTIRGNRLSPLQTVKFIVNDHVYGNLEDGDNEFIIKARELVNKNYLDIKIITSKLYTPKELGINEDMRTLGFCLQSIGLYEYKAID
ncbi:hypothetical protein R84B8_00166 [Treponema sp. R8-4-B8]